MEHVQLATHCVSFVTTHQVIHSEGIVAHLSVDATDDAGAHWTSQEIATGASSSISPPDGYARSRRGATPMANVSHWVLLKTPFRDSPTARRRSLPCKARTMA